MLDAAIPRQPGELEPADFSGALRAIRWVIAAALPVFLLAPLAQPAYAGRWLAIMAAAYAV